MYIGIGALWRDDKPQPALQLNAPSDVFARAFTHQVGFSVRKYKFSSPGPAGSYESRFSKTTLPARAIDVVHPYIEDAIGVRDVGELIIEDAADLRLQTSGFRLQTSGFRLKMPR